MMDEHIEDLFKDLTNLLAQGKSPQAAVAELQRDQERLFGEHQDLLHVRLEALGQAHQRLLDQQNKVKYLQKKAIKAGREQWYLGPAPEGSLWEELAKRLKTEGRTEEDIALVDTDSTAVVSLLDNPSKSKFSTRGLVVGHVQSGKTGNMAAVINKAADTKYKFFLVLSGMTDQLRNQTQARLERDVISLAPARWMQWTTVNTDQTNGDFSEKAVGGFGFDHRNQIAVVKKNAAVLRRFLGKLMNTDEATLQTTPFLIIDDECDQASVNSARYADAITRINERIRSILKILPRAAYVGYTATPFANVLIDTTVPEDLYPRDFIHALQRPAAYFGAQELFGRHALEGEYDVGADGFDMIRVVPSDEISALRPPGGAAGTIALNESLRRAVRYFLMVVAARRTRGQVTSNNTMLVHTSVLNSIHRKTEAVIKPYVVELAATLSRGDSDLLARFRNEWEEEQERVLSEQFDREAVPFSALAPHLADVAGSLKVHVENWTATDRLDYSGGPHTYLVIGGNVLARGLTLDGLSVSYFLRSSSQYDTLMQMGRWFGYRSGFEDLPRVWVEERVRDAFYDLATVEAEIRRDIVKYGEEGMTPAQFAVRIRKIPGMAITAPAKMRHARPVSVGYAGTHVQTFRFRRTDAEWLRQNWEAGASLIDSAAPNPRGGKVFPGVPADLIVRFLREYRPHESHKNLAPEFIASYVEQAALVDPHLARWSVVVVGPDAADSQRALGRLGRVGTVIRSAEAGSGADASIKALMSRKDILTDLTPVPVINQDLSWDQLKAIRAERQADALLLLYPIQARSEPRSNGGPTATREPLDAVMDVLGYGIVFPGDKVLSGTYVSANLAPEQAEPADELGEGDMIPASVLSEPANGGSA
jgi:hypothetical protein